MPTFQENQPDCFYVQDFGFAWSSTYTAFLRVWRSGQTNSDGDYAMVAYTGTPANTSYAQVSTATAFANGDGNYKAQGVLKIAGDEKLFTPKIDVVVKDNLPSPA